MRKTRRLSGIAILAIILICVMEKTVCADAKETLCMGQLLLL